jgi:hypothetical protein
MEDFMKKFAAVMILLALAGCTEKTEFGPCVGLGEKQNPKLHYKVSGWNIAMGVIFVELIAPPIVVAVDETFCPVGPETL